MTLYISVRIYRKYRKYRRGRVSRTARNVSQRRNERNNAAKRESRSLWFLTKFMMIKRSEYGRTATTSLACPHLLLPLRTNWITILRFILTMWTTTE